MASVNKAILVGHLGRDPDMRYLPSGDAVANFSIATSETRKDKSDGSKQEETTWHRCSAFGKLAEICGQYLKKGAMVYLEGRIQTRKWQDKDGNDRYTTEIRADQMKMLGRRDGMGDSGPSDSDYGGGGGSSNRPAPQSNPQQAPPAGNSFNDFEDDIPF